MRKRPERLAALLAAALLVAATVGIGAVERKAKHHHDLLGVITKVEPAKNQFEIKTDAGHIVLCLIDDKSTLRRGSEKITLEQVRVGDRAHCHCATLKDGRHYSRSLLVEEKHK
jgi:hypothetical protein